MTTAESELTTDPLAPASAQFPLAGTTFLPNLADVPSADGTRPWGLRRARTTTPGKALPLWSYDLRQQKVVDGNGVPLIVSPLMAEPTAITTASTDGEDPPSSEDWIND